MALFHLQLAIRTILSHFRRVARSFTKYGRTTSISRRRRIQHSHLRRVCRQHLSPRSVHQRATACANSVAGIRWIELRRTQPGNWGVFQQSTYQPDTTWRWMGSIASDNQGNIALGFSTSSSSINPQIRYAGRLATDPLNTLSGEQHLFDGTGSQTGTSNRWGD